MISHPAMQALTLWPEWAHAILHLGKAVENRDWPPPRSLIGRRLAIHAGKNLGGRPGKVAREEAVDGVERMCGRLLTGAECSQIERCTTSAIVAVVTVAGCDREQRTSWDVPGAFHWRLSDIVPVTPRPMPGAQGLWWTWAEDTRALEAEWAAAMGRAS